MSDSDKKDTRQKEINEKISLKLVNIKEAKKLNDGARWSPVQELMQEIVATHIVINPNKIPSAVVLLTQLKEEINKKYSDEPELEQILLDSIPTKTAIYKWLNNKDFDEAVWSKIRNTGLFTKERRVEMINALFTRGTNRDTQAAKIWLQLSGDLHDDTISKDKTIETFREINQILHKSENK